MAKPSLTNINTTQTFQNWFDKTNEMVDIFKTSAITASALEDVTIGDAALTGSFTATNLLADTELSTDQINVFTGGAELDIIAPINITAVGITDPQTVATFTNTSDGAQVQFTDNLVGWQVGIEDTDDYNFIINTGISGVNFSLSTAGTLTVPNLIINESLTVQDLNANNVYATGDVVTAYSASDIKLKENIQRIDNALDKMDEINGYTFNYKGKEEVVTGVIAQEIEKVLPGVVFDVEDENGTYKSVRYGNIVGLLIEAIKELKDEVETLKNGASN